MDTMEGVDNVYVLVVMQKLKGGVAVMKGSGWAISKGRISRSQGRV
jgi:hypothetical protein